MNVGELGLLLNLHNSCLLISVDNECLSLSLRLIDLLDGICLDLLDSYVSVTFSVNHPLVGLGLRVGEHLLVLGLCLLLLLGLLNDGSLNLLLEQVVFSSVLVLEQRQLLLLFVLEGQLEVFLLLLMVLELDLESRLLCKGLDHLWVYVHARYIALFESDAVLVELLVQLLHHILGHI